MFFSKLLPLKVTFLNLTLHSRIISENPKRCINLLVKILLYFKSPYLCPRKCIYVSKLNIMYAMFKKIIFNFRFLFIKYDIILERKIMETNKIVDAFLNKFINEEIMTKSELDNRLDAVMQKYTKHIDDRMDILDKRMDNVDKRFDAVLSNYKWILGTTLTVGAALASLIIKFWH